MDTMHRHLQKAIRWWHSNDHRYGWTWRVGNGLMVSFALAALVITVMQHNRYNLSATTLKLVGHADTRLTKQLTYDATASTYQFNRAAIKSASDPTALKSKVGDTTKKGESQYALDLPKDLTKGVTYHDINSQLSFSLVPEFKASPGQQKNGHLVYPLSHGVQAVYTLKNNGLKEDIVVQKPTSDTMTFSYTLNLPKTLKAKFIPNSNGAIGIYSADPSLFGNISYGSDTDQSLIQKARENGDKTFLMFGIPAPVITAAGGASLGKAKARFELTDNKLAVIAENLSGVHGPIAIDPSVVVTSTSDFQTGGNDEGSINFSTSGQIARGTATGGSVTGAWASATGSSYFGSSRYLMGSVAYNGFLYLLGGGSPTNQFASTYYVAINSNGTVGTWATTTSLPTALTYPSTVAYSGFMYAYGGYNGTAASNQVSYAPINANGTIGTWTTSANTMTHAVCRNGYAVLNGYLYATGGNETTVSGCENASTPTTYVQYAPILATGDVGAWSVSSNSFTTARQSHQSIAYNGFLYVVSGTVTGTGGLTDVQHAPILANGDVGTWVTDSTTLPTFRYRFGIALYNGYMYVVGGSDGGTYTNSVFSAPMNANGTIGAWQTSSSTFTTARWGNSAVAYNGYLYVMGGINSGAAAQSDTQYVPIDPAGQTTSFTSFTPTNKFTARSLACSVAYNGFLYVIGGSTTDSGGDIITNYYTPISSTGALSNWTATTSLPASNGTAGAGCAAYNGNLYLLGGVLNGTTRTNISRMVPINSNGTLGTWTTTTVMPDLIEYPGVFVYAGSIYVIGGNQVSGPGSTFHAPLNTNGTIGTWVTDAGTLINGDPAAAVARVGNYVYSIGGSNLSGTVYTHVEYAPINANGTIGTWTATAVLPAALGYTQATVVNGCIYVVGGENGGGTSLNVAYSTCPNSNGSITSWRTLPNLVTATTDSAVTSYNGVVYAVGGYSTSVQQYTHLATVNNGGSGQTDTWSTGTGTLANTTHLAGSTAYNGYAYVAGGDNAGTGNSVQYAPLASSGNVGTFTTDAHTFTNAREDFDSVAYNGYLYVIGGVNSAGTTFYNDVQYAPIGSSGALSGGFTTGATYAANGRQGACNLAYNGYMYIVGGWDNSSNHADTLYAPINANGSLGTWADSGNNFTTARSGASCFTANGYLYLVGGNGAAIYNDVQSAPINSNGTLGTWRATTSFNGIRHSAVVGVANGFVYLTGGCPTSSTTCATALGDTQFAPLNPGGTLGNWQAGTTFTTARGMSGGFAYNGYLYIYGGQAAGTDFNDSQYTPLSAIAKTAKYSKLVDLGAALSVTGITYNGTLPASSFIPGVPPITFKAAGSNGVFGSSNNSNAIIAGVTTCLATDINYARYLLITINLDDSSASGNGIFPDAASTAANLTDFTIGFTPPHPMPNIRMRLGRTLQTGNLSAYDSCNP